MRVLLPLLALVTANSVAFAQEGEASPEPASSDSADMQPAPAPAVVESVPAPVAAYESSSGPALPEFHGYATQGFIISDHNNYYQSKSNRGSARLTEVALNISDALTDKLRVVVQMAAVLSDEYPDVQLRLDFGFADYRFNDYFGVRVGRFRTLNGLYSEVLDTDIARTPIFLPTSVYNPASRSFALSANGVQVYGRAPLGGAGAIAYALSGGGLQSLAVAGTTIDVGVTTTGRVIYETPLEGLRIGAALTLVQFDAIADLGGGTQAVLSAKGKNAFTQPYAFFEYANGSFTLAGEYSRTSGTQVPQGAFAGVIPAAKIQGDGFYGLASYRLTEWFTLGGYSSFQWLNHHDRSTDPAAHTFDYAVTTRFDLNPFTAFKLEGHYIDGTSALNPQLNAGTMSDSGWLFAARVSAAF